MISVNDGQVYLSLLEFASKTGSMPSAELATCSAGIERQGQDLLYCHYALWAKILADFNLPLSALTAKLNSLSDFLPIQYYTYCV